MDVAVLGGGSMGVAMAVLLSNNGHKVSIWTPIKAEADQINTEHGIADRLPGVVLSDYVEAFWDFEKCMKNAEIVLIAVPSVHMRKTAQMIAKAVNSVNVLIVCCSKGLEAETGKLLTDILKEEIKGNPIVALSGPSYAIEIARGMPTVVVAASEDSAAAKICQDVFMNDNFRVYTSSDITGVELGGALKNIIALCSGISDGLGFGDDAKAALLTRGIAEIARLGKEMGADTQTFFGLTGMGDLILTCTGTHSRNKKTGMLLGKGYSLDMALKEVNMVVEGVSTAKPAMILSKKYSVEMPIICEANAILYEGSNPRESVMKLMTRNKKSEF